MPKNTNPNALNPEFNAPYRYHDVVTLKGLKQWTPKEVEAHLKHNRIFHTGFIGDSDPRALIERAKLSGDDWLTDTICPSAPASLMMHLAKEMVVYYKVSEDQIGELANKAYEELGLIDPLMMDNISNTIKEEFFIYRENHLPDNVLEKRAKERLKEKGRDYTNENMEATKLIILDIEKKKITNEVVSRYLKDQMLLVEGTLGLERKDMRPVGQNHDFLFQGAACSGKSTISRDLLAEEDKKNVICYATDNFRGVVMPDMLSEEAKYETKDVFVRTQDMAYMIKELVHNEIKELLKSRNERPDLSFDGITLDADVKAWVESSATLTSCVVAYSGSAGIGVAERARYRAEDPNASPADKGRYVNTKSLIEGHANASARLLASVPKNAVTYIYSTDVERGSKPPIIAAIDAPNLELVIHDLKRTSNFLNKRNLNIDAKSPIELSVSSEGISSRPEKKAESLLQASLGSKRQKPYTISLYSKDKPYARIAPNGDSVMLEITDKERFEEIARDESSLDGLILRAITRQVACGSLKKSEELKSRSPKSGIGEDIETFEAAYKVVSEKSLNSITPTVRAAALGIVQGSLHSKPQSHAANNRPSSTKKIAPPGLDSQC